LTHTIRWQFDDDDVDDIDEDDDEAEDDDDAKTDDFHEHSYCTEAIINRYFNAHKPVCGDFYIDFSKRASNQSIE
jgi:hypothetical protein